MSGNRWRRGKWNDVTNAETVCVSGTVGYTTAKAKLVLSALYRLRYCLTGPITDTFFVLSHRKAARNWQ